MIFYKVILSLVNIVNNFLFINKSSFLSIKQILKRYKIPAIVVDDINSKEIKETIYNKEPDLILSCIFDQIISEEIFTIPKYNSINMHPGSLPYYRGPFPSIFAALNGEKNFGVTIHYIDKKLDRGDIIKKEEISYIKNRSILYHDVRLMKIGSDIAIDIINSIGIKDLDIIKQEKGKYYSYPKKHHIKSMKKRKIKLFSIWELFRILSL